MTKKLLKRMITMLLVVTCLVGTVAGCSSNSSNDNETKEAVTTKKTEVTTTEAKTEETTTKDPVKTHEYKGYELGIATGYYDYEKLENITVKPGDILYANDYALKEGQAVGNNMYGIVKALYYLNYPEKCQKFEDDHMGPQSEGMDYEDNFAFTYEGDKPMYFEFIGILEEVAYFDVYPIE